MKNYSRAIFSILLVFFALSALQAQNQPTTISKTDSKTGVRVTTIVKPLPTLSEQLRDFEIKLAEAEKDPILVSNGTVEKYKIVLARLKNELEIENAERRKLEALENKQ
jgi:hypothetical protein